MIGVVTLSPLTARAAHAPLRTGSAPQARSRRAAVIFAIVALLAGCSAAQRAPDFTLIDDSGHAWTLSAQHGHPVLLTFGFTHCSDTCPETLAKLAHLTRGLGLFGAKVEVVMVSVDPQRDTRRVLHRFVQRFDGPIVGLTGSPARVARVESDYHVWAQRIPGRRGKSYDVAHSAVIYVIAANGQIRAVANDDDSEATLAATMRPLL